MIFNRQARLKLTAALILLMSSAGHFASAQASASTQAKSPAKITLPTPSSEEQVRLKQYLDKDGGYKEKGGGYYNPKAGTYTDNDGGTVDNWSGYTYADGSYKSKLGDYYDAPARTMHLASGDTVKIPANNTSAEVIKVLRDGVEQNGGYDKDLTRNSMFAQIRAEHPFAPAKAAPSH
jgi:hypothetical protein